MTVHQTQIKVGQNSLDIEYSDALIQKIADQLGIPFADVTTDLIVSYLEREIRSALSKVPNDGDGNG